MKLIVGLGNPGEQYEKTRHNLGATVVEQFLKDFEPVTKTAWEDSKKFKSDMVELEWQSQNGTGLEKVVLVKPKTYMNNSGLAVKLLYTVYSIQYTDIWIVHDDVDLPLGSIRIRMGGSAGGHRGVQSVMDQLKDEQFVRFRLGIGHPHRHSNTHVSKKSFVKDVDEFVLSDFSGSEKGKVKHLIKQASKAVRMALEEGLEASMNRFNTK